MEETSMNENKSSKQYSKLFYIEHAGMEWLFPYDSLE